MCRIPQTCTVKLPVIFIIMFFTQEKVPFDGSSVLAVSLCPSQVALMAWTVLLHPYSSWSWLLRIPTRVTFMTVPFFNQSVSISFSSFSPHLRCGILSSDNSFLSFPNKDFCVCSLKSFQKSSECPQVFYGYEVLHEKSNLQLFLE